MAGFAARRAADGRLVDVDDFVHGLNPGHFVVLSRQVPAPVDHLVQLFVEHLVDQAALARAGYARDAHQLSQREVYGYVLQVVLFGSHHPEAVAVAGAARLGDRHPLAAAEVLPGDGVRRGFDVRDGAGGHDVPAVLAGAGAKVGDEIGGAHHCFVVLHHYHRVAHVPQLGQGVDQPLVVVGMQPHRGLVADVQYSGQARPDLGGQPHPLGLAAR